MTQQHAKGKAMIGGYVPVEFQQRAQQAARDEGITVTDMIVEAVGGWMTDRNTRLLVERNARQTAADARRGR